MFCSDKKVLKTLHNLECPFFGYSKFLPVFLHQKGLNKFAIFDHSEFVPVFLGKNVGKKMEWPFLAILSLYQSLWEKLLGKFQNGPFWLFQIYTSLFEKNCQKILRMAIFDHCKFIPVFLGKIVRKILEQPFLAIINLYQSFWGKLSEKIQNCHFWLFQTFPHLFGENCCKKFRMAKNGCSKIFSDNFSVHTL